MSNLDQRTEIQYEKIGDIIISNPDVPFWDDKHVEKFKFDAKQDQREVDAEIVRKYIGQSHSYPITAYALDELLQRIAKEISGDNRIATVVVMWPSANQEAQG